MLHFEICTKSGAHKKEDKTSWGFSRHSGCVWHPHGKAMKNTVIPSCGPDHRPLFTEAAWAQGTSSSHDGVTWEQWKLSCAVLSPSVVSHSETPGTVACQALLSVGFSRQEYWSGLPCSPPGNLPHPWIEPVAPALQIDSLLLSHQGSPEDHHATS